MARRDTVTCPTCGAVTKPGRPMAHHLRDAHGLTGMAAHLVANPDDKQAARSKTAARAARQRHHRADERFDVIEDYRHAP